MRSVVGREKASPLLCALRASGYQIYVPKGNVGHLTSRGSSECFRAGCHPAPGSHVFWRGETQALPMGAQGPGLSEVAGGFGDQ